MARDYAALYTTVWADSDWRSLTMAQQHCYWLLLTQPKVSPCGVLDFIPGRLAGLASDMSRRHVETTVSSLCEAKPRPYLILDPETYELLLRSFVRWDSLIKAQRAAKAIAKDYGAITSPAIKKAVAKELSALWRASPGYAGWKGIREQDPALSDLIEGDGRCLSVVTR